MKMYEDKVNKTKKKARKETAAYFSIIITAFVIILLAVVNVNAQFSSSNLYQGSFSSSYVYQQTYMPSFKNYYTSSQLTQFWPKIYDVDDCRVREDFIVQIPPAGCTPTVIRSDLLEEQPVPVFCQLNAIKVNPLIDVSRIRMINFKSYPSEITGVGFHPANSALRTLDRKLLGSPVLENIGYVVVLLKPYASEREMPNFIEANLTAFILYDAEKIFGVGKQEFYLPVLTQDEWENLYKENSFWKGKGYLRADWIEDDRVAISVYTDATNRISGIILEKGMSSEDIYLPGYHCRVALNIRLNSVTVPDKQVKLAVSSENGEDEYWLREGSKFEECRISSINIDKFWGGSVDIICPRDRFTLSLLTTSEIELDANGINKYKIGEEIKDNIYPIFIGELPTEIKAEGDEKRTFLVLVKTKDKLAEGLIDARVNEIRKALDSVRKKEPDKGKTKNKMWFVEQAKEAISRLGWIDNANQKGTGIIFLGDEQYKYEGIKLKEFSTSTERKYENEELEDYFKEVKKTASEISDNFPDLKDANKNKYYGEVSLEEAAALASILGKKKSQAEILSELIEKYPESPRKNERQAEILKIKSQNSGSSYKTTEINDELYTVQLVDFKGPDKDDLSVELRVDSISKKAGLDEDILDEKEIEEGEFLKVKKIDGDYVLFRAAYYEKEEGKGTGKTKTDEKKVLLNGDETVGRWLVHVDRINIKKVASVSLMPKAFATQSQSNFTFRIGIEKRAIKLSPERTEEMLSGLDKSIEKWEKISESLGKVVKGMKGACFATTAVLTVKNLIQNMGGRALARQDAMRGEKGWYDKCADLYRQYPGEYASPEDCLIKNNVEIEKTVTEIQDSINKVDERAKEIYKSKSSEEIGNRYRDEILVDALNNNKDKKITLPGKTNPQAIGSILNPDDIDSIKILQEKGYLEEGDMRDISKWLNVLKEAEPGSIAYDMANAELSKELNPLNEANKEIAAEKQAITDFLMFEKTLSPIIISPKNTKTIPVQTTRLSKDTLSTSFKDAKLKEDSKLKEGAEVTIFAIPSGIKKDEQYADIDGKSILAVLDEKGTVTEAYSVTNGEIESEDISKQINEYLINRVGVSNLEKITPELCRNKYINPEIRFYETSPYKGRPAIVPVDIETGWYAATKQILSSFSGMEPYTEAGEIKSFWLVNVGKNGREEFNSLSGDDRPRTMINLETRQPLEQIGCLDADTARKLVNQAIINIEEAASRYGAKEIGLSMLNKKGENFKVGLPAGAPTDAQCQDFMSPADCQWLFNLCDPVLCPSSRCDLGGTYHVDNVVQSGIIGSIALCLPNIKEGIVVPVCLTGIHAGLDAYTSILKAKQQCLKTSLETGQMVGICDEIYSIYACEFFWRQFAPIVRFGMPKLLEIISGKGTRGGGEYASVSSAWKNMEDTMSYFTNEYAVNAMEAFKMRSTDEAGTEICKVFVSQRYPSGKGFFDSLLEPDSPPQFYATFDEIPYTEATLPATSHYKVAYHIYAGKDRGSYYSVYLKNPPETSFYASNPYLYIDSGYVANSSFVSQTIDTTAPAGYKELCVRIDLKEECGFKQVSTDFLIDYISKKYAEEQAAQEITTEKECISGTISALSLLQPNIQEGIQETIQPEIYKRGLTRVCSTEDPGETIEKGRWKDVGYCDDKGIRCWLDTRSVKDVMKQDKGILNETLTEIDKIDLKNRYGEPWGSDESKNKLKEIEEAKKAFLSSWQHEGNSIYELKKQGRGGGKLFNILEDIKEIQVRATWQAHRVEALKIQFELYKEIVNILRNKLEEGKAAGKGETGGASAPISEIVRKYTADLEVGDTFMMIDVDDGELRGVVDAKNTDNRIIHIRFDSGPSYHSYPSYRYYDFDVLNRYIDRYWKQHPETGYTLENSKIMYKGEETGLYIQDNKFIFFKYYWSSGTYAKSEWNVGNFKDSRLTIEENEELPKEVEDALEKYRDDLSGATLKSDGMISK